MPATEMISVELTKEQHLLCAKLLQSFLVEAQGLPSETRELDCLDFQTLMFLEEHITDFAEIPFNAFRAFTQAIDSQK